MCSFLWQKPKLWCCDCACSWNCYQHSFLSSGCSQWILFPSFSPSQIFRALIDTSDCIHSLAGQAHLLLLLGFCFCGAQEELLNLRISEGLVSWMLNSSSHSPDYKGIIKSAQGMAGHVEKAWIVWAWQCHRTIPTVLSWIFEDFLDI